MSWQARKFEPNIYAGAIDHRESMKVASLRVQSLWQFVGPSNLNGKQKNGWAISGRVNAVAFDPKNNGTWYLGAPYGGVWKSTDFGGTWTPLTDNWKYLSVSSIAIDPVNSNNLYVGTGDVPGQGPYSIGIMKSSDAGKSWSAIGTASFGYTAISWVVVDPDSPNIIMAATWGGQVWRSADGGAKWTAVIPQQTTWLRIQYGAGHGISGPRSYYAVGEGNGAELWRSDDLGLTWKPLQTPLSNQFQQRPLIATSPVFSDTLYLFSPTDQKIFKGQQYGQTWEDVSGNWPGPGDVGQETYNFCMACSYTGDPHAGFATDVVYIALYYVHQSTTGGGNWTRVEGDTNGHSDQHALAVDPFFPNSLLVGNDGGVFNLTYVPELGISTVFALNKSLVVSEFYRADYAPLDPTNMIGGTQDTGCDASLGDINNWIDVTGGDGGSCVINPLNPDLQYAQSNFNDQNQIALPRTTDLWSTKIDIHHPSMATEPRDLKAPMVLDPSQPWLLYVATNYLYRWTETGSSDLTNWQTHIGGQQLSSNGWVNAIAVAPSDSNRIYTGSNDNEVWMSTDAGKSWRRIDAGMPQDGGITSMSVNPHNTNDILVGLWRLTSSSHFWRCQNTSAVTPVWADVTSPGPNGLPAGIPVDSIARDPFDPENTWYVGTDIGVFSTDDAGAHWYNATQPLGLPNAPVSDLKISGSSYLYAATFGRGIWRTQLFPPVPRLANFEAVTTLLMDGSLAHYYRDNSQPGYPWIGPTQEFGGQGHSGPPLSWPALIQSNLANLGNLEVVALDPGITSLAHFWRDSSGWHKSTNFAANATGAPGFIQSASGNFEVVVPLVGGRLAHYYRDNSQPGYPWIGPTQEFGAGNQVFTAAVLIQSSFGDNLEVVAYDQANHNLAHFWRDSNGWHQSTTFAEGAHGAPGFIQGGFGIPPHQFGNGNFEVVVPQSDGSFAHYYRDNQQPGFPWIGPTQKFFLTDGHQNLAIGAITLIESLFGDPPGNLEAVAVGQSATSRFLVHCYRDSSGWHETTTFAPGAAWGCGFIQRRI